MSATRLEHEPANYNGMKQDGSHSHPHQVGPVVDPGGDVVEHCWVSLALVIKEHVEAVLSKEADGVDKAAEHGVIWQVVVTCARRAGVGW